MQLAAASNPLPFALERAKALADVGNLGKIGSRTLPNGKRRYFLDFRSDRADRFYTFRNNWGREVAFETEVDATLALQAIREKVSQGFILRAAITAVLNLSNADTLKLAEQWLEHQANRRERGRITGRSLRQMESDVRKHWTAWKAMQVQRITPLEIEKWEMRLTEKMAGTSARRVLATFHSFLVWAEKKGELTKIPAFPEYEAKRTLRPTLTWEEQDAVLAAIDEKQRGVFLALAELALRPGEARALDAGDIGPTTVSITKAAKDYSSNPEIGDTKTGMARSLEIELCPRLMEWAVANVAPEARLQRLPAFPGPRGPYWGHRDLLDEWKRASKAAGVRYVPIRDATRKTAAREHRRRGVPYELLREYLGHTTIATTEIYAETGLADLSGMRRKPKD